MASIAIRTGANRSQGARILAEQRTAIIYALENRLSSQTKLAKEFGCHRNTIANTYQSWLERNDTESRPRSGRPPKFKTRSRYLIEIYARQNPFGSYRALASRVTGALSKDTIRRVSKRSGIVWRPQRVRSLSVGFLHLNERTLLAAGPLNFIQSPRFEIGSSPMSVPSNEFRITGHNGAGGLLLNHTGLIL